MEEVRPWCGQPSDQGRLRNRTERWSVNRISGIKSQLKSQMYATRGRYCSVSRIILEWLHSGEQKQPATKWKQIKATSINCKKISQNRARDMPVECTGGNYPQITQIYRLWGPILTLLHDQGEIWFALALPRQMSPWLLHHVAHVRRETANVTNFWILGFPYSPPSPISGKYAVLFLPNSTRCNDMTPPRGEERNWDAHRNKNKKHRTFLQPKTQYRPTCFVDRSVPFLRLPNLQQEYR